jgi:tryptophan synthase alpha chain
MSRIDAAMRQCRAGKHPAVFPFICGGHPRAGATAELLPALARAGAPVIEVGIPFSDPIADGPVIAAAMHEALALGATPASVLDEIRSARGATEAAVVAMVSYSIVRRAGEEAYVAACAAAGVDGLIVPDLPLEESASLRAAAARAGLTCTLLIAPTTPPARAEEIARASTGFVYLIARAGITGERADLDTEALARRIEHLRRITPLPLACGFGISTADQVRQVLAHADAAIVGSALVRRLSDAGAQKRDLSATAAEFMRTLTGR